VTIAWQGGEPTLMGLDFSARAVALVERHRPRRMQVEHTLQTNGVNLDHAWCAFLQQHRFLVGLSLDGPRAMHDAYRVGRGTFDKVVRAARLLRRHQVAFNVLCTVHAANVVHPLEVYDCGQTSAATRRSLSPLADGHDCAAACGIRSRRSSQPGLLATRRLGPGPTQ
jgi:uncharacterized protein